MESSLHGTAHYGLKKYRLVLNLSYYDKALSLCKNYRVGQPILDWHVYLITQRVYSLINLDRGEEALFAADYFEYLHKYSDYLFALGYACAHIGMFQEAVTFYLDAKDAPLTLIDGTKSYNADHNIRVIREQLGAIKPEVNN